MSPRACKLLHIFCIGVTVPMLIPVTLPLIVPVAGDSYQENNFVNFIIIKNKDNSNNNNIKMSLLLLVRSKTSLLLVDGGDYWE